MMTASSLTHALDRTVVIRASRETVFRYFTDSSRWAAWWGAGSTIDAKPGGRVFIRHPEGTEAAGEVQEVDGPRRIVFTYGFVTGKPIAVGASRVTIELDEHSEGTRLHLSHEFADASARDEYVQGWRYQLSVFSNVVANEIYAGAAAAVDGWFGAWAITDEQERTHALSAIADPAVQFRDRYSLIDGLAELVPHIGAAQRFMKITLQRKSAVRQCQGVVLADWAAVGEDGKERATGTNVFTFRPDGRVASVVGFWK